MKSRIAVTMIVEAVGWVETAVGTIMMIRNAHPAIGEADRARICWMEIPIAVDTTTEIGEMTEKVCKFYLNFIFAERNESFEK